MTTPTTSATSSAAAAAAAAAIPIIPDNPNLSWASMALSALILLDVSTEIGEYHRALQNSPLYNKDYRRLRQARKAVNRASLEVCVVMMTFISASSYTVQYLYQGMDWRMTLVLEGLSRLESAYFMSFICCKTPRWIGIYWSGEKQRRIQHVGEGLRTLRFHVRWSICQYFLFIYCFWLPFCGRPLSVVLGFAFGFGVEIAVMVARKLAPQNQARMALLVSLFLAIFSSVLFADGCHYIQTVWGFGAWRSEWGLGVVTFCVWFACLLVLHYRMWRQTEYKLSTHKRFSVHDKEERMAISLIFSQVFGSNQRNAPLPPHVLQEIQEEEQDDQVVPPLQDPTLWMLIKERWSTPSELVFMTMGEIYGLVLLAVASLFLVVVNIGATAQMNVVRQHFSKVHHTLYGHMEQGPVCAFDKVGGTIETFPSREKAHEAGYKVAHCGACGACSDWHNLRLQYTTREYLAKESAKCARKSLLGGRDAVLTCLEKQEPIGFSGRCAECWTEDIFCARGHCAFIFLQSNMINTVANFQVGEDTITAATCEEAMCELEFVPCSGANRRRMHIQSTIARPGRQLCDIVDVDWAEVFGEEQDVSGESSGEDDKKEL